MDLASQALDVTPWRPEAYEQARTRLRGAMADAGPAPESVTPMLTSAPSRAASQRRRTLGTGGKVGIGAGIGAVAAGVAVALAVTSAPQPSTRIGSATGTTHAAASPLVELAARITASSGKLPGNASLIIRTQTEGGIPPQVSYNLYVDNGAFYGGGDKKSLMEAVRRHQNMADGVNAREVAAARYAATGDLATARMRMINASPNWLGLGLSRAEQKKLRAKAMAAERAIWKEKHAKGSPPPLNAKRAREDAANYLWNNSVDALSSGAGSPQVRAGVLRLLSTISGVKVTNSTTGGKPTLTLTAGPAVFVGQGKQVLSVSARTGMPIRSWMGDLGPTVPPSVDTYKVIRVTMAGIEAGRF